MKHSLYLHGAIYDKERVLQATDAFKHLANIRVRLVGEYIVCDFSKCRHDLYVTQKEFENYLIDLMNMHHDT